MKRGSLVNESTQRFFKWKTEFLDVLVWTVFTNSWTANVQLHLNIFAAFKDLTLLKHCNFKMFYSSRKGLSSSSRKQTSFSSKTTSSKHEDGNKSGNETDCGSAELLDISTSREDLSASRCSCHSGGSNVAVRNEARDGGNEHFWTGNLR